ncbi:YlxR family protein [Erysipelothrix inopinata]|uniref:YlxR family protein n=1 Tax=Erysipelothrix inopinata TaxID=225084 RepID=A0A7G9RXM9_9FIRM|nr:YlxR family protein [Erysipelothrix inopinata]QNN60354.1 YlxR family protein [Erysipelothrix inopinata]
MRKIPMRKCVVTQEQFPKNELLRVVMTPEGTVEIDESGRKNGRGAYLSKTIEAVELAKKNRALDRALKTKIDDEIFEELMNYVQ